ncbi:MAG: 2-oxoacid:ferredoxin oxidoreductase subunit beta [Opitutales bacterium]|nr:2-oxoacid:ferredoxin oxidoreductase subunit beta [Opitutales bacterium]
MSQAISPSSTENLTRKDFVTSNDVRWCPGCGDYAILNAMQRTFAELGVPREKFVVVSGIGCSSRFPYYMNTYGFHTIHGRAPTVATGVKVANPDLSVWVITGDGDGLSIGGNHLMHMLRRNVNVKVLLFNNRIYGLTKGQYSPTSPTGLKTKSTPMGSIDHPINPLLFALGAESTFVARTVDTNVKHMSEVFKAAHEHEGAAFIEVLQNCVIFNDGTWDPVASKENRDNQLLYLNDGEPLRFGPEQSKGLRMKGFDPEVVDLNEEPEAELIHHDPEANGINYAQLLAHMSYPQFPTPMGVIWRTQRATYESLIHGQVAEAQNRPGRKPLQDLLNGSETWQVS